MKTISLKETKHYMCFTCPIKLKEMYCPYDDECSLIEKLDRIPDSGAEYVIRCKDCTQWTRDSGLWNDSFGSCKLLKINIGKNGYCVFGQNKYLSLETETSDNEESQYEDD